MKTKTTYTQIPDNGFFRLDPKFKTECCDCGLVHVWQLTFKNKIAGFKIKRDNRATAQRRKLRKWVTPLPESNNLWLKARI